MAEIRAMSEIRAITVFEFKVESITFKQCCGDGTGAGAESRRAKLICILKPEPKLRIAALVPAPAPAHFYLSKT
jgi:hypothetical protein